MFYLLKYPTIETSDEYDITVNKEKRCRKNEEEDIDNAYRNSEYENEKIRMVIDVLESTILTVLQMENDRLCAIAENATAQCKKLLNNN